MKKYKNINIKYRDCISVNLSTKISMKMFIKQYKISCKSRTFAFCLSLYITLSPDKPYLIQGYKMVGIYYISKE